MSTNFKLKNYDLIVLGAGSGGLAAAKRAASYGASVAIIEGDQIGGTCVVRGCVPKKMLVYGSMYGEYIKNASSYGIDIDKVNIRSGVLLKNIQDEVKRLSNLHQKFLEQCGVEIIEGWGEFSGPNSVTVRHRKDPLCSEIIEGERILISVGSTPIRPSINGAALGWVSDDIFLLQEFPQKILIVGAGFIACEFACILNGLGVEVSQLVRGDRLLKGFDSELTFLLKESIKSKSIDLYFGEYPLSIDGEMGSLEVQTNNNNVFETNGVLFAIGRQPFIEGLNLEKSGVSYSDNKIKVDEQNRTNIPNIFAIGDVTDRFNLTPVAVEEGRVFSDRFFGGKKRLVDYDLVPKAVFSQPEIASVGLSEEDAIKAYGKDNIKVYRSKFRSLAYSIPKSDNKCLLKLIVQSKSDRIVGCHMIGEHAAEIIQMASISLLLGAKKSDFDLTMALHPTIAEEFVTMT